MGNKLPNYLIRIVKDEWMWLIFSRKAYYTSLKRTWKHDSKIVFVKKIGEVDSIIGYGILDNIVDLDNISAEEKIMCLDNGWTKKLIFSKMIRFEPPIPIKDTEIAEWPQRGALLHGAPISDKQLEEIIKLSKVIITY